MADPTLFQNCYVAISTSTGSATYTEIPGVKSVRAPFSAAELDDAVMGDTVEAKYPGLFSRPVSVEARQDFATAFAATAGLDLKMHTLLTNRTKVRLKIRPVDTTVGGTNPSYIYGSVRVFAHTPIDGAHGELLRNKIEFRPASGFALTRSTAT